VILHYARASAHDVRLASLWRRAMYHGRLRHSAFAEPLRGKDWNSFDMQQSWRALWFEPVAMLFLVAPRRTPYELAQQSGLD
jgi:hypothetical protein